MARHFLRLKLSLLSAAFRKGWQRALGLLVGLLVGIPAAVLVAVGLAGASGTEAGAPLLVVTFTLITVGWTLGPVLVFGLDETLDPRRLRLLPLSGRDLVVGLTVAGAVGLGPLLTLIVLFAGVAYVQGPAGVAVAGSAVVLHFLICLWAGRALVTALSAVLRSRRGRDFATIVGAILGGGVGLAAQLPNVGVRVTGDEPQRLEQYLGPLQAAAQGLVLTPMGWAAGAILAAADGRFASALALLGATAVLAAALAWAWLAALERTLSVPDATTSVQLDDEPLVPAALRLLPRNHLTATMAKELRYAFRAPQARMNMAFLAILSVALVAAALFVETFTGPQLVYAPAALGLLHAMQAVNMFAYDRGAVWLLVAASPEYWHDLAGKTLAQMAITLAGVLPLTFVIAGVVGEWGHLLPAMGASLALLATIYGVSAITSVVSPYPLSDGGMNVMGGGSGMGCATVLMMHLTILAVGAVLLPPAAGIAWAVMRAPSWLPVAALVSVAYGFIVWASATWVAAVRLEERAPEFLAALSADTDR